MVKIAEGVYVDFELILGITNGVVYMLDGTEIIYVEID